MQSLLFIKRKKSHVPPKEYIYQPPKPYEYTPEIYKQI